MKKVLITGGTGLVGTSLKKMLEEKGYQVRILSRNKIGEGFYFWNWEKEEIDIESLRSTDFIIHLAGANIGEKRWNRERKRLIMESRVKTLELIYNTLKKIDGKPSALISASAVGYYGSITSDKILREDDEPGKDFLAYVCKSWEEEAMKFGRLGVRVVRIRTGVVLSKKGGALERFKIQAKLGAFFPVGSGKQFFPWVHIEDLCRIYIRALEDEKMEGAYNAVAPEYVTQKEFLKTLSKILKKPFFPVGVPSFLIKLIFGEMGNFILKGSRVSSEKMISSGFEFKFKTLKEALEDLFGEYSSE